MIKFKELLVSGFGVFCLLFICIMIINIIYDCSNSHDFTIKNMPKPPKKKQNDKI